MKSSELRNFYIRKLLSSEVSYAVLQGFYKTLYQTRVTSTFPNT